MNELESQIDEIVDEFSDDIGYILLDEIHRKWSNTHADELQKHRNQEFAQQILTMVKATHKEALEWAVGFEREYEVTDLERMDFHQETPLKAIPTGFIKDRLQALNGDEK